MWEDRLYPDRLLSDPPGVNSSGDWYLGPNECLVSDNGTYYFCYEADGNVHIYKGSEQVGVRKISKSTDVVGDDAEFGIYKDTGHLYAVYNGSTDQTYWRTRDGNTTEEGPWEAVIGNDGNFRVLDTGRNNVVYIIYKNGSATNDGESLPDAVKQN